MRKLWRVYKTLTGVSWAMALEYRAQAILWLLSFVFPLVMMTVWLALVNEVGPAAGWGQADFVSYYVGASLVSYLTSSWMLWDWDEQVRTGALSPKLLRPVDPFHQFLTDQLGWKIFTLVVFAPIIAVAAWLSPLVNYPLTPTLTLAFAASAVLGFLVQHMLAVAFGMLSFWTTQVKNLYQLVLGVGQFLSGFIAPLALFPEPMRQVANLLPFRSTLGFPLEVMMGRLTPEETVLGFGVSCVWLVVFVVVYRVLWRLGLRRYEAVGA